MRWYRIVPVIDLICLLVELSDPTTPFVRVDANLSAQKTPPSVMQTVEDRHSQNSESSQPNQSPAAEFQVTSCHSAIEMSSFHLKIEWLTQEWTLTNTAMTDQAYPETLRRPPIV